MAKIRLGHFELLPRSARTGSDHLGEPVHQHRAAKGGSARSAQDVPGSLRRGDLLGHIRRAR